MACLFRSVSFMGPLLLVATLGLAAQQSGDPATNVGAAAAPAGQVGLLAANGPVRFAPDTSRAGGVLAPVGARWSGILDRSASGLQDIVATGWPQRAARGLDRVSLHAALAAQPANDRRCVHGWRWTVIGTAAGFGVGFWAGFGAFDEAINSDQKIWTTAIVGAAAGGLVGYLVDRHRATCSG
jgi:hypothetical protein